MFSHIKQVQVEEMSSPNSKFFPTCNILKQINLGNYKSVINLFLKKTLF